LSADPDSLFLPALTGTTPGRRGRKPKTIPVLRDSNGGVIPRYITEKMLGDRRPTGAMKLKHLTNRHLRIIGMHLEGHSGEFIAQQMSCTISTVSRILNDPLAQTIIKRVFEDRKGEVHALGAKALEAVRDGLAPEQSLHTRLRAVDKYAKIRTVMIGEEKGDESAEDVIARMLGRMTVVNGDVNIQVNEGKKGE